MLAQNLVDALSNVAKLSVEQQLFAAAAISVPLAPLFRGDRSLSLSWRHTSSFEMEALTVRSVRTNHPRSSN